MDDLKFTTAGDYMNEGTKMNEYFKHQIESGATDNFFYGTEINGEVRIERHRGPIQTLVLDGLEFDRMMGATPFFKSCMVDMVEE